MVQLACVSHEPLTISFSFSLCPLSYTLIVARAKLALLGRRVMPARLLTEVRLGLQLPTCERQHPTCLALS